MNINNERYVIFIYLREEKKTGRESVTNLSGFENRKFTREHTLRRAI